MRLDTVKALMVKELTLMRRDVSFAVLTLILPVIMMLIYGYGMNLDVKPVRLGVVYAVLDKDMSARLSAINGSEYLALSTYQDPAAALKDLRAHALMGLYFEGELSATGEPYLMVNGSNAALASSVISYSSQAMGGSSSLGGSAVVSSVPQVTVSARMWFNEESRSAWYLVPGQVVGILTLVAAVMGATMIAREWNRGTLETLLNARVSPLELVVGKLVPCYLLCFISMAVVLFMNFALFEVPLRGSGLWLLLTLLAYLFVALNIGLLISALTRDLFLATEYSIILSFMPAVLLSGLLYDLRAVPWFIECLGRLLPPTYAIESVKICTLSGGSTATLLGNLGILLVMGGLFFGLTVRVVSTYRRSA